MSRLPHSSLHCVGFSLPCPFSPTSRLLICGRFAAHSSIHHQSSASHCPLISPSWQLPHMDDAVAALVLPWLEPMLRASYFSTCRLHADAARSECNMFCVDCPASAAFCFYCRSSSHSGHRTVQIRRSSYHDVVRVAEVQTLLDISGVQTYVINSARVLFLNERPQPRGGGAGASSVAGKPVGSGAHICEICRRTLLDPFRFCSLGCKLEAIKRNGDACFVPEEGKESAGDDSRKPPAGLGSDDVGEGRRRRRRGKAKVSTGGEQNVPPTPPPPPSSPPPPVAAGHRRRKGVPHRSPLGS